MDDRLVNSFLAAAEFRNMTLAAEKLHITQSALSRQIQKLEEQLGVNLFERSGKKIKISPEGEALIPGMHDVQSAARRLRTTALELTKGDAGVLKVGACSQCIESDFPDLLAQWRLDHPRVDVQVAEGGGVDLDQRLQAGELHVVVNASTYAAPGEVEHVALHSLHLRAAGTPACLGAAPDALDIVALSKRPVLVLDRRHVSRDLFDAACRMAGVRPTIALEGSAPHILLSLAATGLGVAVVPAVAHSPSHGLTSRCITFGGRPIEFELSAMWLKKQPLPAYARRFVSALVAHTRPRRDAAADPRHNVIAWPDRRGAA